MQHVWCVVNNDKARSMLGTGAAHGFERHVFLSATNDTTRRVSELS